MAKPDQLRIRDIRAAYRLIGECRELGQDPTAWRMHMLEGLRTLTGAQVALHMQMENIGTEAERIITPLEAGFMDAGERALWVHYYEEQAHLDDPFNAGFLKNMTGGLRTRRLESVVEPGEWYRSRHYNDYVRACRLDDRITSTLALDPGDPARLQVIVLHRAQSDGKYSRRDQRLVHLFHHELGGLVGTKLALPEAGEPGIDLPFRLQQVLFCLIEGDSEKQIAARLGLSPHTVNRHVQRLYRRDGVTSRAELTFRCHDMRAALARPG